MTGKKLMSKTFIDTNIVVYANDKRDPVKQKTAVELIAALMDSGGGVISAQVLQEYAAAAGCSTIISEDLDTGQFYSGVAVINPFI